MIARFARVYPLHVATLLWVVGLYVLVVVVYEAEIPPAAREVFAPAAIPLHLLMLHGFNTARGATWNTPSWSIGSEWLAYLAFPFLTRAFRRLPTFGKYGLLVLVFGAFGHLTIPSSMEPTVHSWLSNVPYSIATITFPNSTIRCFAGFALGMVTHFSYTRRWALRWLGKDATIFTLGGGLAASCHFHLPDMLTVWLFPLLILGGSHNTGRIGRLLGAAPLRLLGRWSYSIYMVHMPIIFSFLAAQLVLYGPQDHTDRKVAYGREGPLTALAFVGIVVLVSALTHRTIESPARSFLRAKRSPDQGPSTLYEK
jgi:peptidoglycan/LPS O-acetylase OafA/YrhL